MSSRVKALEGEAFRRLDEVITGGRASERARGLLPSDSPQNESDSWLNFIEANREHWRYLRSGSSNHAFQADKRVLLVTRKGVDRNYDSYLTPVLAHHLTETTEGVFVPVCACTAEWTIQNTAEGSSLQELFPEGAEIPRAITDQVVQFCATLDSASVSNHVADLLRQRRGRKGNQPRAYELVQFERDRLVDLLSEHEDYLFPVLDHLGIDIDHIVDSVIDSDVLTHGIFASTKLAPIHQRDLHAGNMNVAKSPGDITGGNGVKLSIYDINEIGQSVFPREIAYWLANRHHTLADEQQTIEQATEIGERLGYPDMPRLLDHFIKLWAARNVEKELTALRRYHENPAALNELLHGSPILGLHFAVRHLAPSNRQVDIDELREQLIDGIRRHWGVQVSRLSPTPPSTAYGDWPFGVKPSQGPGYRRR